MSNYYLLVDSPCYPPLANKPPGPIILGGAFSFVQIKLSKPYINIGWTVMPPVQDCERDGKPGKKWGNEGKCYVYTPGDEKSRKRATNRAREQGKAIEANKN